MAKNPNLKTKDKLTKKQRIFVEHYALTENGVQSALKAYDIKSEDPTNVAKVIAGENLTKPNLINAIEEKKLSIAERIPDDLLVKRHTELLNQKDPITGKLDAQAVGKGLDMAYKIKGTYAPEKTVNLDVNVDITNPQTISLAKEYEEKLKNNL